jgi:hypothetical protein
MVTTDCCSVEQGSVLAKSDALDFSLRINFRERGGRGPRSVKNLATVGTNWAGEEFRTHQFDKRQIVDQAVELGESAVHPLRSLGSSIVFRLSACHKPGISEIVEVHVSD